jgi:hypothetical protein
MATYRGRKQRKVAMQKAILSDYNGWNMHTVFSIQYGLK